MALMYPPTPKEFDKKSLEGQIFATLEKLNDEYRVFHSLTLTMLNGTVIEQSETDFVIFHPKKGIICIEAKAGQVYCDKGVWYYGSKKPMPHDGPFSQASRNMFNLMEFFTKKGYSSIRNNCSFLYAVWFPSIRRDCLENAKLPSNAPIDIIITEDSNDDIESAIERIYRFSFMTTRETKLSEKDINVIMNNVLAPSFNLVSLNEVVENHRKLVFKRMLSEQVSLLNYLEDQNNAIINGLGGTGKTVIAIEKARRHASNGESVLFLCYNRKLKDYLQAIYDIENVSYFTIDGFACSLCNTFEADYGMLKVMLETMYCESSFPYQHIIIDEGQDFGRENFTECELIELLKMNAIDNESRQGTFYMFYDKNQMVQSRELPKYIQDADCKLTLYRNCRNTKHIAISSLRLLHSDKQPKLFEGAIEGVHPTIEFVEDDERALMAVNSLLDKYINDGYHNITIITCKTEENSIMCDEVSDEKYLYRGNNYLFTTCRKFKGLESDVVILVDVDSEMINDEDDKNLYVGSSRARFELSVVVNASEEDCKKVCESKGLRVKRNYKKALSTSLNMKMNRNSDD